MGLPSVRIVECAKKAITKGPMFSQRKQISCEENTALPVPRGHFTVYLGEEEKKRFVVPLSYLKHPLFQELLQEAEEEFSYDHRMGGLTVPCREYYFTNLISRITEFQDSNF